MRNVNSRLQEHGITLPEPTPPLKALLRPTRLYFGPVLKVSAQLPKKNGVLHYKGKVGRELTLSEGRSAARLSALNAISQCHHALGGDLDRVTAVLTVRGYVNAVPEFTEIAEVVNGASEVFLAIFGDEIGMHTRTAIGASVMPFQSPVEIEVEFAVTE